MIERFSIILLSFLGTVYGQDPVVTITESDPLAIVNRYRGISINNGLNGGVINVRRDRDLTMSCYVENKQLETYVRWQMEYEDSEGRRQVRAISYDTSVADNTKYSIEKPTQFTWKLRLKSTQLSDAGNYTCFVYTTRANKKEANMTIDVLIPPYLDGQHTSSDTVANEGENVHLVCDAYGKPQPVIEWSRLGGALLPIGKEKHYESKLDLLDVRPEDRGKYRCRVENSVDTIERTIVLHVQFKPVVTPIHPKVYQAPGFVIELQCYAEANPFPETGQMKWMRGDRGFSIGGGRFKVQAVEGAFSRLTYELIINGVEEEDYGTYSCQIRNSFGTTTRSIELIRSGDARPSYKLGRIIKGAASTLTVSIATLFTCLIALWNSLA